MSEKSQKEKEDSGKEDSGEGLVEVEYLTGRSKDTKEPSLKGSEIKSIRGGQISLAQAYVTTDGREAWLMNAHIAQYNEASRFNHDPLRPRKLLLHSSEIRKLSEKVRQKGATIATLKTKTGLDSRQLSNALYKLSKKRLVRAKSRGLYVKH